MLKSCQAAWSTLYLKLKRIRFSFLAMLLVSVLMSMLIVAWRPAEVAHASEPHRSTTTSITREADKPLTFEKVKQRAGHSNRRYKAVAAPRPTWMWNLWGMNKSQLERKFPTPQFSHNADYSQIRWRGTDISSVLDIQFVNEKVDKIRYTTHYGYPRPGTKSNVEISPWMSKPASHVRAVPSIKAFKEQLKQH